MTMFSGDLRIARRRVADHKPIAFMPPANSCGITNNVLGRENRRKFTDAYPTVSRSPGLCFEYGNKTIYESGLGISSSLHPASPRGREEEGRDVFHTFTLHPSQLQAARGCRSFPVFRVSSRMSTQFGVHVPNPGIMPWLGRGTTCNPLPPKRFSSQM